MNVRRVSLHLRCLLCGPNRLRQKKNDDSEKTTDGRKSMSFEEEISSQVRGGWRSEVSGAAIGQGEGECRWRLKLGEREGSGELVCGGPAHSCVGVLSTGEV